MAKAKKKPAKEASETFHSIMKASVKGNPIPEKKPHEILLGIVEAVKKLNKKYPISFVKDGLETQIRAGFRYISTGRELVYTINPNWPPTISEDVKQTIENKAAEHPSIIIITTPIVY